MTTQNRPLHEIAAQIRADWKSMYFGAVPYVEAMEQLNGIGDTYMDERAEDIVRRFLFNASTWRGETARAVKKELRSMLA